MSSVSLYKLADEFLAAANQLADLDLPPEAIKDTLESLSGDLEVKAVNVAMFVRGLDATIDAMKAAEKDMATRRKAAESRQKAVTEYLLEQMKRTGIDRIDAPQLTLSIRANPAAVEVFDAAQVPADYMAPPKPQEPTPDKTRIKDALKLGLEVPGCRLVTGTRLHIA